MTLQIDPKLSLGNLIVIVTLLASLAMGWATMGARIEAQNKRVGVLEERAAAQEVRIRATELAQAAAGADLKSIQRGIVDLQTELREVTRLLRLGDPAPR